MKEEKDPIQAVGKIVIIKEMEIQKTTASGIIIEGMKNKEPFAIGTVVSVGEGIQMIDGGYQVPQVSKGDVVFYSKNHVATMNGLIYINSDHIVAVVNDKSKLPTGYYEVS